MDMKYMIHKLHLYQEKLSFHSGFVTLFNIIHNVNVIQNLCHPFRITSQAWANNVDIDQMLQKAASDRFYIICISSIS